MLGGFPAVTTAVAWFREQPQDAARQFGNFGLNLQALSELTGALFAPSADIDWAHFIRESQR